jgi:hypothetical protein
LTICCDLLLAYHAFLSSILIVGPLDLGHHNRESWQH